MFSRSLSLLRRLNNGSMAISERRGFVSKDKLHHKKSNSIPFYVAADRIGMVFVVVLFVFIINDINYPDSFIKSTFGFEQIEDAIEEDKPASEKKRKKIRRYHDFETDRLIEK